METNKRACFALVAATLVNKRRYNGVYDYFQGKHINVSSTNVETSTPHFYDHNRGASVSGSYQGMYDYATSSHVSIRINDRRIDCYDYESGNHITFTVNGNSISAYDYETNSYYNYSIN